MRQASHGAHGAQVTEKDERQGDHMLTDEERKAVRDALLEVIEECRKNECGEAASVRLRAMSEAALVLAGLP